MSIRDLKTYEILKEEDLTGIQAKGYLLRHKKSRARVLLIEKDDNNKVFSIGFRTPPGDSTGVPVIGVLYGYGSFQELEAAGADGMAAQVENILEFL